MVKSIKSRFVIKGNRARRRIGQVILDVLKAFLLAGVVFSVAALMVYAYLYTITHPLFRIQETVVRGCVELTEKDVLALANIGQSQNLMALNGDAVARRVAANPWVKKAHVGRELPNRLVIEVKERKAVALIMMDDEMYLLDGDGVPFKKNKPGESPDLPILTGFYRDGVLNGDLLRKSLALLDYLATATEFPSLEAVSEVHGNDVLGFSVYTNTGLCLQLGFDAYEHKLKRLIAVIADLERKNLNSVYLTIDLRDPGKITVQRTDISGPPDAAEPKGAKPLYRI